MKYMQMLARIYRDLTLFLILAVSAAVPLTAFGQNPDIGITIQNPDTLSVTGKLLYHGESTYSPSALLGIAMYAGVLQQADAPRDWGQGAGAYGKRFASTLAWSGIHSTLAFGLDSTLHQDPQYFPSGKTGF